MSLLDGANTVSLSCTGSLDKTATDWFEVVYARNFAAVSDSLKFTHAGGYRYRVAGFTSADAELYDVTDPAAVVRVVNGSSSGSGPYTLEAEPAGASGARSYLAVASAGLKTPAAVVKDRASSLSRGLQRGGLDLDHAPQPGLGRGGGRAGLGDERSRRCARGRGCGRRWWTSRTSSTSSATGLSPRRR